MMQQNKRVFSLRWLVFAVLILTAVSSVTLSRYMTTVSGTATATIANFGVVAAKKEGQSTSLQLNSTSKEQKYSFTVENTGDVKVEYDVIVTLPAGMELPAAVTMTLDDKSVTASAPVDGKMTYTFSNCGTLEKDAAPASHTLTLSLADGATFGEPQRFKGIKVSVYARQVVEGEVTA